MAGCINVCVSVDICANIGCTYAHMYVHINTNTHMHTCIANECVRVLMYVHIYIMYNIHIFEHV